VPEGAGVGVFYFFQRGPDFVRCEINGDEAGGYSIVITEPDGKERTESFSSSDTAHARFLEIQERLKSQGWWGPHGRE
jgi:hypothetical protein